MSSPLPSPRGGQGDQVEMENLQSPSLQVTSSGLEGSQSFAHTLPKTPNATSPAQRASIELGDMHARKVNGTSLAYAIPEEGESDTFDDDDDDIMDQEPPSLDESLDDIVEEGVEDEAADQMSHAYRPGYGDNGMGSARGGYDSARGLGSARGYGGDSARSMGMGGRDSVEMADLSARGRGSDYDARLRQGSHQSSYSGSDDGSGSSGVHGSHGGSNNSRETKKAWLDELEKEEENKKKQGTVKIGWIYIRDLLFQVMFFNSFGAIYNSFFSSIFLLVEFLQMLDFVLRFEIFTLNNEPLLWLKQITSSLTLRQGSIFMHNAIVVIAYLLVFLVVVAIFYLHGAIKTNTYNDHPITKYFLRYLLPLFPPVLFIPFFSAFVELLRCEGVSSRRSNVWADDACGSVSHLVFIFTSLPFAVAMLIITYFVTITHFDPNPSSLSVISMSQTRIEQLKLAFVAFLCIIMGPMRYLESSHPILLAITITLCFSVLCAARVCYFPHNRFKWCLAYISRDFILAWAGILLVIAASTANDTYLGPSAAILWSQPFLVLCILVISTTRRWKLIAQDPYSIRSALLLDVYFRLVMSRINRHLYTESYKHIRRFTVQQYDSIVQTCEDIYQALFKSSTWAHNAICYYYYAQFAFEYRGNYHTAHRYAAKAQGMTRSLDVQYMIFRLQQLIEMHYQTRQENREILSYIAYEHHVMLATKHDAAASKAQLYFWTLLTRPKPDINRLNQYAIAIAEHNKQALHHYRQVLEINPQNPHSMRMYASFLLDVMQDKQLAQQQLDLAQYAEEARKHLKHTITHSTESSALFDEKSAILVISGDDEDLGMIQKSNARANMLFGWTSSEFVGKHATSLFAEPFASTFAHYISDYQDAGHPLDNVTDSMMMCKHKSQFVFPAWLQLRKFVEKGHMRVLLLIEHIQASQSVCSVIVSEDGYVHGVSANAASLFGVSSETLHGVTAANAKVGRHTFTTAMNGIKMQEEGRSGSGSSGHTYSGGSGPKSGRGNLEEDVDGSIPKNGGSEEPKSYATPLHMAALVPNFTKMLWRPLRTALSKFHNHPLIDGSVDLEDTRHYVRRRDKQKMDGLTGRYRKYNLEVPNPSIKFTFHTANGYFQDDENDPFLHNDRKHHDLTMSGLSVNPYLRQSTLDVPLSDRRGVRVMNREKNPFIAVQSNRPRCQITFVPQHRPESWTLDVQILRIAGTKMPLYLLAIYPSPNVITIKKSKKRSKKKAKETEGKAVGTLGALQRQPSQAQLGMGTSTAMGVGMGMSEVTNDVEEPNEDTFDGGLNNYMGDSYVHNNSAKYTKEQLAKHLNYVIEDLGPQSAEFLAVLDQDDDENPINMSGLHRRNNPLGKIGTPWVNEVYGANDKGNVGLASPQPNQYLKEMKNEFGDHSYLAAMFAGNSDSESDKEMEAINLGDDIFEDDDDDDDDNNDNNDGIKISERLRKEVLQDNEGIVRGLHKFRRIFIFSVALVCACALALFITSIVMLSSYENDLSQFHYQVSRNSLFAMGARSLHYMHMMNANIMIPTNSIPYAHALRDGSAGGLPDFGIPGLTIENYTRLFLADQSKKLETMYLSSNRLVQNSAEQWVGNGFEPIHSGSHISANTIKQYTDVQIPIKYMHGQTAQEYVIMRSLQEFLAAAVTYSRFSSVSPLLYFSPYVYTAYLLMANFASVDVLKQGAALDLALQEDTLNTVDVLSYIIIALVALPILSLFLVIVVVLRPTVFEIEENKSQVILVFLDIPTNIVVQLKQIYTSRIQSFQQSSVEEGGIGVSEDMEFMDMFDEHEEMDDNDSHETRYKSSQIVPLASNVDLQSVNGSSHGGMSMGPGAASTVAYDAMSAVTTATHAAPSSVSGTHPRSDGQQQENITFSSDKYVFLLKICLLFLLTVIYFVIVFFTGIFALEPHLANAPVLIRINSMRATSVALATHFTTILATFSMAGALLPSQWPQPNEVRQNWMQANLFEEALMNGHDMLGVTGYFQKGYYPTARETTIAFGNACGTLEESMSPLEPYCPFFRDGVMTKGTHEATKEVIKLGEFVFGQTLEHIKTIYAANNSEGFTDPSQIPDDHVYPSPVYLSDAFVATQGSEYSDLMVLCDWVTTYILSAYTAQAATFIDAVGKHVDATMIIQLILLIIFATLSVMVYIFVYIPLIHLLDTQIKRTRSMLLMIPADVLESIPAARLMLQNKQTVL